MSKTTDTLPSPQKSPISSSRPNYDKKVNYETKGSKIYVNICVFNDNMNDLD